MTVPSPSSSPFFDSPRRGRPRPRLAPPFDSPAQLALIGLGLWLVGALLHPLGLLAPLGLLVLLVAGLAYLLRPRSHTMYWRGRRIDLDNDDDQRRGPTDALYRRLFRR